jgi:hypothetical protein
MGAIVVGAGVIAGGAGAGCDGAGVGVGATVPSSSPIALRISVMKLGLSRFSFLFHSNRKWERKVRESSSALISALLPVRKRLACFQMSQMVDYSRCRSTHQCLFFIFHHSGHCAIPNALPNILFESVDCSNDFSCKGRHFVSNGG